MLPRYAPRWAGSTIERPKREPAEWMQGGTVPQATQTTLEFPKFRAMWTVSPLAHAVPAAQPHESPLALDAYVDERRSNP